MNKKVALPYPGEWKLPLKSRMTPGTQKKVLLKAPFAGNQRVAD